ncbi:hypothetical protein [Arthrobacter pityocampae]|uniref:hypothetical protein n=1 Tax=Arthrobacter pityocampae TaxID=547334 RepID=UPI0011B09674|nr:hypothetical protein [Arthrobacter pityocampae]
MIDMQAVQSGRVDRPRLRRYLSEGHSMRRTATPAFTASAPSADRSSSVAMTGPAPSHVAGGIRPEAVAIPCGVHPLRFTGRPTIDAHDIRQGLSVR